MNVVLNGTPTDLPADVTIVEVLAHLQAPERGVAVAVDAEVVPRSQWERTALHEGAHVEVVQAVQGG